MKPSKKTNGEGVIPTFRNWLEDFWGTDRFFDRDFLPFPTRWTPSVNIKENKTNYVIEVAAPGLTKKDFKVEVEKGVLTISAEKEETKEEKATNYTRREFSFNSFERTFALPENADAKNITAKYDDGVLKLTMKKIKVKSPEKKLIEIK